MGNYIAGLATAIMILLIIYILFLHDTLEEVKRAAAAHGANENKQADFAPKTAKNSVSYFVGSGRQTPELKSMLSNQKPDIGIGVNGKFWKKLKRKKPPRPVHHTEASRLGRYIGQ